MTYRADGTGLVTWDATGEGVEPSAYAALVTPGGAVGPAELAGTGNDIAAWFGADGRPRTASVPVDAHAITIETRVRSAP